MNSFLRSFSFTLGFFLLSIVFAGSVQPVNADDPGGGGSAAPCGTYDAAQFKCIGNNCSSWRPRCVVHYSDHYYCDCVN
jgi:hypothetical protein